MKSNKLQILKIILCTIFLFIVHGAKDAHAVIPTLTGRVVYQSTGMPVANVWVKMTTSGDSIGNCPGIKTTTERYELTDSNGVYTFDPQYFWSPDMSRVGKRIDTNQDGTLDSDQLPDFSTPHCEEFSFPSNLHVITGDFGCGAVPMTFEVVKPVTLNGTFTKVTNFTFANVASDTTLSINDIEYTPSGGGGPTSAPTSVPTIAPTIAPTTPPVVGCTDRATCSTKEIVQLSNSVSGLTHSVITDIDESSSPWIRLTINGNKTSGSVPTQVEVEEQVNATYFDIVNPQYTATTKTFFITKKVAGVEQDITPNSSVCNGAALSCIIAPTNSKKVTFRLDPLTAYDTRYVYMQVLPLKETSGSILVNNETVSEVTYKLSPDSEIKLNNTSVTISSLKSAFFQTFLGNTYSFAEAGPSIKSILPATGYFLQKLTPQDNSNPIVFYNSPDKELGKGQLTDFPTAREVKQYAIKNTNVSYNYFYNLNKGKITDKTSLPTPTQISAMTEKSAHWRVSGTVVIDTNWKNANIQGKNITVYVPGDLIVQEPFTIAKDGKSSVAFIVGGKIGVNPSVNKLEGIYLSDGVFDTACQGNTFGPSNKCAPDGLVDAEQLELHGMFISNGGYNLDRRGVPGVTAGEAFFWRPDLLLSASDMLGSQLYSWKESQN